MEDKGSGRISSLDGAALKGILEHEERKDYTEYTN
jgi:hypothetical protein